MCFLRANFDAKSDRAWRENVQGTFFLYQKMVIEKIEKNNIIKKIKRKN